MRAGTIQPEAVLLTIGRLPVALDLARSFSAAGWRVVVAEPLGMHLCRMSRAVDRCRRVTAPRDDARRYLEEIRRIVSEERITLVVPTSEESVHVAALEREPGGPRVFAVAQETMLALHDKLRFARVAAGHGLAVPRSALPHDEEAERIAAAGDFVVKPRHSCSGRGVRFLRCGEPVPPAPGAVVQEHVDGELLSSFAIARAGEVVVEVTYRGAIMSGSVAVAFERVDAAPQIERWVRQFVASTHHTGFIAFDFVVDPAGRAVAIECNPRSTSGIHFVDTRGLATAVTGAGDEPVALREAPLLAESYSCLTAALGAARRPSRLAAILRRLRRARDVTWSPQDPWPFLLMTFNTCPLLLRALRSGRTVAEVAVLDVEWREQPAG